jgi:hypothetical protein
MDFDCVYVLAQQADPSSAKNAGKEIAEAGSRLFWNNINRLLMDYPKSSFELKVKCRIKSNITT